MSDDSAEQRRQLFHDNEEDKKLADIVEKRYPNCECEKYSIGQDSPGLVDDDETLYRIMVSPRDYDRETKHIAARPFEKVYQNGLSVVRSVAPNGDLQDLVVEGLTSKIGEEHRQVLAVCTANVGEIRKMGAGNDDRAFCVYDQTVKRVYDKDAPPVPTHASVFQRWPLQGVEGRKSLLKDLAGKLRDKFLDGQIGVGELRDGLLTDLNGRASAGEFEYKEDPAKGEP